MVEMLFEEWSADPVERQRQIDLVTKKRPKHKKRKSATKKKVYNPKPLGEDFWDREPWEAHFISTLPMRPRCAADYTKGVYRRQRDLAINYPHIQFNSELRKVWLIFDIDRAGASQAHQDACVAVPNLIIINQANGHAHIAYELAKPVTYYAKSRQASIDYLASIQRAMTRRLDADKGFSGDLPKNPLFDGWLTIRLRQEPYTLGELASFIKPKEMKKWEKGEKEQGLGRNVTLFNEVRKIAYRDVCKFKDDGYTVGEFAKHLLKLTYDLNHMLRFYQPLPMCEVRAIAKSVAKWVWLRFSSKVFSDIQTNRIRRRWKGHVTAEELANELGVSRATYYRMSSDGRLSISAASTQRPPQSSYYLDMVSSHETHKL